MDEAAVASSWSSIAAAIGAQESTDVAIGQPAMWFEYFKWHTAQYVSRPVVAAAFSLIMVAGGWITTVSAADSLPGEKLYSVKKLTEKAQLKLASLDRKAVLHTEFAGRRLQEAVDLQAESTNAAVSAPLVSDAIEAYKQEVASAAESLRQLKDEDNDTTLATATSVQHSLQAIDSAIDEVAADSTDAAATQDVITAKEITSELSEVATTVVVEVHEEEQSDLSAQELKQMFKQDLGQIEARQRFDLERIEVIRAALADVGIDYTAYTLPTATELRGFEYPITAIDGALSQAMNNFAAGGYRSAFDTLQEIDNTLLDIEAQLAQIEIMIMTARAQTQVPQAAASQTL